MRKGRKSKQMFVYNKQAKKTVTVFWDDIPTTFGRGYTRPRINPISLIRGLNESIKEEILNSNL
ncbi:MAG: hypothetical protein IJ213_00300 [Bacteroidales bacterium]|nr:hypothetical protein [Bacteroidales bacterium]